MRGSLFDEQISLAKFLSSYDYFIEWISDFNSRTILL